jgi:ribosome-binding factor A
MPSRRRSFATTERRYPRTARLNELLREVLAEELERLADHDERLTLITVTGVEIEADLRHAKVLFSSLAGEANDALEEGRVRLQAAVGRQIRMKRTPQLAFAEDPAVAAGRRVEDILREIRENEPGDVEPEGTDRSG